MKKYIFTISLFYFMFSCSSGDDSFAPPPPEMEKDEKKSEDDFIIIKPNLDVALTNNIVYGKDFVVFEPEVTTSPLGFWKIRKKGDVAYYASSDKNAADAINDSYLEFTGNNLNSGPPKSPLSYTFKAPKTGKFRIIMRMLQPLKKISLNSEQYEPEDKRNDLWIKLEGDFTTACSYPTMVLKKNKKFWGRGVRKWGSLIKLEDHINGAKVQQKVVYNFKEGENYKLTISGRAQGCSIDYILFYDESKIPDVSVDMHSDPIELLPKTHTPITK